MSYVHESMTEYRESAVWLPMFKAEGLSVLEVIEKDRLSFVSTRPVTAESQIGCLIGRKSMLADRASRWRQDHRRVEER